MNQELHKLLTNGLRLYYKIIKLHHKQLPRKMRMMGDYYVRQEFKHHHDNPQVEYYQKFYSKWQQYYDEMSSKGVYQAARHINEKEGSLLTKDQREALNLLRKEIT